jgi:hypothetical protein
LLTASHWPQTACLKLGRDRPLVAGGTPAAGRILPPQM